MARPRKDSLPADDGSPTGDASDPGEPAGATEDQAGDNDWQLIPEPVTKKKKSNAARGGNKDGAAAPKKAPTKRRTRAEKDAQEEGAAAPKKAPTKRRKRAEITAEKEDQEEAEKAKQPKIAYTYKQRFAFLAGEPVPEVEEGAKAQIIEMCHLVSEHMTAAASLGNMFVAMGKRGQEYRALASKSVGPFAAECETKAEELLAWEKQGLNSILYPQLELMADIIEKTEAFKGKSLEDESRAAEEERGQAEGESGAEDGPGQEDSQGSDNGSDSWS